MIWIDFEAELLMLKAAQFVSQTDFDCDLNNLL